MFNASARRADGVIVAHDANGREIQQDTMQCRHCGGHWVVVPGSGLRRGWCHACGGPTCGSEPCMSCDHFMRKIERAERGNR